MHAHCDDCKRPGLTQRLFTPHPPSPSFAAILWYLDDGSPTSLSQGVNAPQFMSLNRSPSNLALEGMWSSGYIFTEWMNVGKTYTANAFGTRGGCWQMITREAAPRAPCGERAGERGGFWVQTAQAARWQPN